MSVRHFARAAAAVALAMIGGSAALAQNYDGDTLFRFGAFGQGTFLNYGVTRPAAVSSSSNGLTGGLSAGIDYHPSKYWLMGVEIDAGLGDARGLANGFSYGFDYLATLRGRFGVYPDPDWLIYGTAGVAFLGTEVQSAITSSKAVETLNGLVVGFGVEYNWHHVILFGEYDYATFGTRQFTINNVRHETDADMHALRFGIKFKVGHDHHPDIGRHYDPLK